MTELIARLLAILLAYCYPIVSLRLPVLPSGSVGLTADPIRLGVLPPARAAKAYVTGLELLLYSILSKFNLILIFKYIFEN